MRRNTAGILMVAVIDGKEIGAELPSVLDAGRVRLLRQSDGRFLLTDASTGSPRRFTPKEQRGACDALVSAIKGYVDAHEEELSVPASPPL